MTQVLFMWFEPDAGGKTSKYMAWLPECPAVGTTVHIPLGLSDYRGKTDLEDSRAMTVRSVSWTCDGSPHWHAEIYLT